MIRSLPDQEGKIFIGDDGSDFSVIQLIVEFSPEQPWFFDFIFFPEFSLDSQIEVRIAAIMVEWVHSLKNCRMISLFFLSGSYTIYGFPS